MLRHIVLITFRPEASAHERAEVLAAARALAAQVPEIRSITVGEIVGSGPNHHDFAAVVDFDDMAAFRRYIDSPAHAAYVEIAKKAIAKLAAIQHEF